MNNNYETVIIFTPVLNDEEVKKQIKKYIDLIKEAGGSIVHEDFWGLRQLAYPIQKKTTGIYHILEYDAPGGFIDSLELQFRRDENVIRFLTTVLDKFALDYNERKRNGLIGRKKDKTAAVPAADAPAEVATKVAAPVVEPAAKVVEEVAAPAPVEETPPVVEAEETPTPAVETIETPVAETEETPAVSEPEATPKDESPEPEQTETEQTDQA